MHEMHAGHSPYGFYWRRGWEWGFSLAADFKQPYPEWFRPVYDDAVVLALKAENDRLRAALQEAADAIDSHWSPYSRLTKRQAAALAAMYAALRGETK